MNKRQKKKRRKKIETSLLKALDKYDLDSKMCEVFYSEDEVFYLEWLVARDARKKELNE